MSCLDVVFRMFACTCQTPILGGEFAAELYGHSGDNSSNLDEWENVGIRVPSLPCLALPCLALPCLALPCLALPCLALPCLALPCLALPCLALPCLALPCLALPCLALPCLALPCLALPCLCCICSIVSGVASQFDELQLLLNQNNQVEVEPQKAQELHERLFNFFFQNASAM